jgi:serine/threonine protein kinase
MKEARMTVERLSAAIADRYTIERELGAGGMATDYLAQDLKHDRKVAIKALKPELAAVLGGERFLAAIKTTANLQHHFVRIRDVGERADEVVYVETWFPELGQDAALSGIASRLAAPSRGRDGHGPPTRYLLRPWIALG